MSGDQLQPEDTLDDRGVEDVLDEGFSPPERPRGVTAHGVTAREELEGESLEERIAQEEPDVEWPLPEATADIVDGPVNGEVGEQRAGRLASPGHGPDEDDRESAMVAEDMGIDGAGASAEEAAVHVVDPEGPSQE